jgi:hypothetical protein
MHGKVLKADKLVMADRLVPGPRGIKPLTSRPVHRIKLKARPTTVHLMLRPRHRCKAQALALSNRYITRPTPTQCKALRLGLFPQPKVLKLAVFLLQRDPDSTVLLDLRLYTASLRAVVSTAVVADQGG